MLIIPQEMNITTLSVNTNHHHDLSDDTTTEIYIGNKEENPVTRLFERLQNCSESGKFSEHDWMVACEDIKQLKEDTEKMAKEVDSRGGELFIKDLQNTQSELECAKLKLDISKCEHKIRNNHEVIQMIGSRNRKLVDWVRSLWKRKGHSKTGLSLKLFLNIKKWGETRDDDRSALPMFCGECQPPLTSSETLHTDMDWFPDDYHNIEWDHEFGICQCDFSH